MAECEKLLIEIIYIKIMPGVCFFRSIRSSKIALTNKPSWRDKFQCFIEQYLESAIDSGK